MPVNSKILTFPKEGGTGGIDGHFYEIKFIAYLFLIARSHNLNNFRIACNFKAVDNQPGHDFQDVALQYTYYHSDEACSSSASCPQVTDSNSKRCLSLYQLKCSTTPLSYENLTAESGSYSLKKYFEWVKKLWAQKKSIFGDSNYNDCIFNLVTTGAGKLGRLNQIITEYEDLTLATNESGSKNNFGKYFVFNENCSEILNCLSDSKDDLEMKKKFISQLRIYPGQPSLLILDHYIKIAFMSAYGVSLQDANIAYPELVGVIQRWWERKGKARFLTFDDFEDIWHCVKVATLLPHISNITDQVISEYENMNEFGVQFVHDEELCSKIQEQNILNLLTIGGTTKMTCVKFCQTLQILNLHENFIILKLSAFLNDVNILRLAWYKTNKEILLLICDDVLNDTNPDLLMSLFINQSHFNYFGVFGRSNDEITRKIVFVDLQNDIYETLKALCNTDPSIATFNFSTFNINIDFSSLTEFSQEVILSKNIQLTDKSNKSKMIQLKNLKGKDLKNIKERLHIEVLWMLMQNQRINIITSTNVDLDMDAYNWALQLTEGGELTPVLSDITRGSVGLFKKLENGVTELNRVMNDPEIETVDDIKGWIFKSLQKQFGDNQFSNELLESADKALQEVDVYKFAEVVSDLTKALNIIAKK